LDSDNAGAFHDPIMRVWEDHPSNFAGGFSDGSRKVISACLSYRLRLPRGGMPSHSLSGLWAQGSREEADEWVPTLVIKATC
jgi:hypothetical protein